MSVHLARQIDKLKKMILQLGAMVEEALRHATEAVERRDPELAARVIAGDRDIDLSEIDVEEECLATLALHQPVAGDLRYVVAILKINRELERIADLAASMAEQAAALAEAPPIDIGEFRLGDMARQTQIMLKQSLDALVQMDVALAQKVRDTDDEVDAIYRGMYPLVERKIREDPQQIDALIRVLSLARQIERLADHAVNIAKDVIYLATGQIVRHSGARAIAGAVPHDPS
jgi:phosphate transport system protein